MPDAIGLRLAIVFPPGRGVIRPQGELNAAPFRRVKPADNRNRTSIEKILMLPNGGLTQIVKAFIGTNE